MKTKIITSIFLLGGTIILSSAVLTERAVSPCDAPLIGSGYAGAPGETHCGTSGCHSGSVNSGPGTTAFNFNNGLSDYQPGQTYTLNIDMDQSSIDKFGFQVIAIKDDDNSYVGSYTLTDPTNTRLLNGSGGRKYVGSTPCGSDAPTEGSMSWTFDWNAPTSDEGSITFYLSTIATNHNHSSSGDNVYTQELQVAGPSSTGIADLESSDKVTLYPNPAVDHVAFKLLQDESNEVITVKIYNDLGQEVAQENIEGSDLHQVDLKGLDSGIYIMSIKNSSKKYVKQLVINK